MLMTFSLLFQIKNRETDLKRELSGLMNKTQNLEQEIGLLGEKSLLRDYLSALDLANNMKI